MGILDARKNKRAFIHRPFIYDFGLMMFGMPLALYVCWKCSSIVAALLGSTHSVVAAAAYLYIFLFSLWAYRVLFGYAKWAFPTVDLTTQPTAWGRHRLVWSAIMLGVLGNFAYDVLKSIRPWE